MSWFLIAILIFWTAALFFGIGLYAEPNGLVYAALAFGASRAHSAGDPNGDKGVVSEAIPITHTRMFSICS